MSKKSRFISILLIVSMFAPRIGCAENDEERLLSNLKKFRWDGWEAKMPPCASLECRLHWASAAIALGDAGGYARRVKVEGMQAYANSRGITQDFKKVADFESWASATPAHFSERFDVMVKNKLPSSREEAANFRIDSRIIVPIFVNDKPVDVIFDTGATLTIPGGTPAADSIKTRNIPTKSTSGLGKVEVNSLGAAQRVSIGNVVIHNLMVRKKVGLPPGDLNAVGLIGYDLLLRFDRVTFDLKDGRIKFNPEPVTHSQCASMEMVVDKNSLPAGLAVDAFIDGLPFKTRIDTGANVDVVLHGHDVIPLKKGRPSMIMLVDGGGHTSSVEEFDLNVSLAQEVQTHRVLRSPYRHNDFAATFGIKFFAGRSFTFDFRNQQFCLD